MVGIVSSTGENLALRFWTSVNLAAVLLHGREGYLPAFEPAGDTVPGVSIPQDRFPRGGSGGARLPPPLSPSTAGVLLSNGSRPQQRQRAGIRRDLRTGSAGTAGVTARRRSPAGPSLATSSCDAEPPPAQEMGTSLLVCARLLPAGTGCLD